MTDEKPTPPVDERDEGGGERRSATRRTESEEGRSGRDPDAERTADAAAERAGGDRVAERDGTSDGREETEGETVDDEGEGTDGADADSDTDADAPPSDVQKYARFKKMDGAEYDRVNEFLRDRTYVTAREWAIARLCADFRTETGVEMTKIGNNLPQLVPFMTDTYTPQAVNQARSSFEDKVRKSGATFLYGAMSGFFTAEELDELMYEVSEIAKFLLEVEGVDLSVADELEAEERISSVMREVRRASADLREQELAGEGDDHDRSDPEERSRDDSASGD
jgi:hypothetical protein